MTKPNPKRCKSGMKKVILSDTRRNEEWGEEIVNLWLQLSV